MATKRLKTARKNHVTEYGDLRLKIAFTAEHGWDSIQLAVVLWRNPPVS